MTLEEIGWNLYVLFSAKPPLLAKLRVRPLAAIELDIARATIPAMRPENV